MLKKSRFVLVSLVIAAGCGAEGERVGPAPQGQALLAVPAPAAPKLASSTAAPEAAHQAAISLNDPDPVLARIDTIEIRRSQITGPLIESYGLNVLLNTAELEMAEQAAAEKKVVVTQKDFDAERDGMLAKMFVDAKKEDYPQLLEQFFAQQHIGRAELDIVIQTNAYLRKIAEPMIKESITENRLQESYKALYGETIQVRHIQCANLQEIAEAKRRVAAGEAFEKVARELSRNPQTRPLGGEMPPFSRYADYPDVFKDVAFSLKVGEVSDTVETGGVYHIIQLEKRFEPKAIKYEDVKDSLREDLIERLSQSQVKNLRAQLVAQIAQKMTVTDPVLAKQYEAKKSQTDAAMHGKKEAIDAIHRDQTQVADELGKMEPTSAPATLPSASPPSTQP